MTTNNNPLFNLGTKNDGADATLDVFVRNGATFGHEFSNGAVFDDTWRHFAWVDSNKVGTLYIDGVADSTFDYSSVPDFTPDTTTFGGILRGTDCCNFTGKIDETSGDNRKTGISGAPLPIVGSLVRYAERDPCAGRIRDDPGSP